MTDNNHSPGIEQVDDAATEGSSARGRIQNDLDPLAKGEAAELSGGSFPEAQDGGRPDGLPSARTDTSVASGETLVEPGASDLEGTAS